LLLAEVGHTAAGISSFVEDTSCAEGVDMTSFLAIPFALNAEGKVEYGEARQVSSEFGARCLAAAMVATSPGALVLSKTDSKPPEVYIVACYGIGADEPPLAA
jgi:hypothetical protein